ncbi:hypothetical protein Fleli_0212 [Bernardetia litoralis DSM 6794]|uniref:Uncharacterized protein n=1 Tax=Bernardetia litoralis (strain ATCC 23117 / DSM 6794 / NBRC 15988 / NCIMB 1366 / Fx l1 / Sio-4) TaxID=880071 RepID=I4AFH3_BERLS|nr:hypothetical protein [Bernardetia litoralis]AFM02708.1 hypothetical protein Fleli_0212 [Bernardetia litoralis DSM 6794]
MKANILIYILSLILFFFSFTLMAQTNEASGNEDGTEAPPYDKKWNIEIIGDFFENQRTAPIIIIDSVENVYLAGTFLNELNINKQISLKSKGGTDAFLLKFDTNGKLLWKKQAGGIGNDYVGAMRMSKEGGVILSGHFKDSTSFDRIKADKKEGGYVANYDKNGTILWVKTEDKTNYSLPQTDRQLNLYLAESYKDKVKIDTNIINNPTRYYNSYLSKYDNNDKLQWFTIINKMNKNGRGEVKTSDMAIDDDGNIFLGGTFKYAPVFDNIEIRSGKQDDVFLAKYNNEGKLNWVLQLTNSNEIYTVDRVYINNGNICLRATAYLIDDKDTIQTYHQFEYNEQATSVEYHSFYGWEVGEDITGDSIHFQYSNFVQNTVKNTVYKFGILGNKLMLMKLLRKPLTNARREEE